MKRRNFQPMWYTPDGQPADLRTANDLLANGDARRVALTRLGMWEVSTVFLVLDHAMGMGEGPPVLWETMLFCHDDNSGVRDMADLDCRRYTSREGAERGHEEMVSELRVALEALHESTAEADGALG